MADTQHKAKLPTLILGAIGVVYGDIGTSPLYALKETFAGHHPLPVIEANILGVLSVMFWTIMLLVSIKYVTIVMRADNRGEGGSMALLALVSELTASRPKIKWLVTALGVFAAALFFGDGMITPAVSVLSAVEGLDVISSQFSRYVIPVTLLVLTGLFFIQKRGTGAMGLAFGPIMIAWFICLGSFGALSIVQNPQVLLAVNPLYAYLSVDIFAQAAHEDARAAIDEALRQLLVQRVGQPVLDGAGALRPVRGVGKPVVTVRRERPGARRRDRSGLHPQGRRGHEDRRRHCRRRADREHQPDHRWRPAHRAGNPVPADAQCSGRDPPMYQCPAGPACLRP